MTARLPAREMGASRPATEGSGRRALATIALITLMLPVTFSMGTWTMSPSRALFLVLLPIQLFNLLRGQYGKVTYIDWLILGYMAWRTFVPFIHNPQVALQYAGSNSVIFLGGYLVGRATIRTAEDFQWMAKVLAAFVIFSFPFAIYETITGKFVIPHLFEKIPGVTSVKDVNYMRRMGMDRVQFVFVHPIHYGLFCSLALSVYFIGLRGVISGFWRWIGMFIIIACCLMSVSSGPFLSTMAQVGLIFYAFLFRNVDRRWLYFGLFFAFSYTVIELGSNRPGIVALMSLLTFSASTANVRFVLFEYGMAQIMRTPLFGIGFRQWDLPSWMTGSMDNFWLGLALIFGLPAFLFMFGAVVAGLVGIGKRAFKPGGVLSNVRLGWGIMLVSLTLTLATVYIWSEVASLTMFMIGSGVFLLHAREADEGDTPPPAEVDGRAGPTYSRFAPEVSRTASAPPARQRFDKGRR
ncbi:O-antigen ligase family protein [Defluviimonas sp. SAOS-178_SWC]|uniref:O-antigen ligase family protein n=1 Tax=Defluviimonas sp. SAOS-178_SWC TaxID=3121287 RepID=UPI003221B3B3